MSNNSDGQLEATLSCHCDLFNTCPLLAIRKEGAWDIFEHIITSFGSAKIGHKIPDCPFEEVRTIRSRSGVGFIAVKKNSRWGMITIRNQQMASLARFQGCKRVPWFDMHPQELWREIELKRQYKYTIRPVCATLEELLLLSGLDPLSMEALNGGHEYRLEDDLFEKFLWLDEVKQRIRVGGECDFSECQKYEDGVLQLLAGSSCNVSLGIPIISGNESLALSSIKNSLRLNNLKDISVESANNLGFLIGDLYLNGIETVSPGVIEGLSRVKGELHLDGLKTLSDECAGILEGRAGLLSLKGLTDISAEGLVSLVRSGCSGFDGLVDLEDGHFEALGERSGTISLNEVRRISGSQFNALAKNKTSVSLNSVSIVDDGLASEIGKSGIHIRLDGVKSLGFSQVQKLMTHSGLLELNGIKCLTPDLAEYLGRKMGEISMLGLSGLSKAEAKSLVKNNAKIITRGETTELLNREREKLGMN